MLCNIGQALLYDTVDKDVDFLAQCVEITTECQSVICIRLGGTPGDDPLVALGVTLSNDDLTREFRVSPQ